MQMPEEVWAQFQEDKALATPHEMDLAKALHNLAFTGKHNVPPEAPMRHPAPVYLRIARAICADAEQYEAILFLLDQAEPA